MESRKSHVVFLHEIVGKKACDKYLLNLAHAYLHMGHKVTVFTAQQWNRAELIEDFKFLDEIEVRYSGSWIPRHLLGFCHKTMSWLRAACMAFRVALLQPNLNAALIVMDVDSVAICILHYLTRCRLLYYEGFRHLRSKPEVCEHTCLEPSFHQVKFMKMAHLVLVENASFAEIYYRSFPALDKPLVLYRSIDCEGWMGPKVDIKRIIPDMDENFTMLLSVDRFTKASNFKLVMDAFEILLQSIGDPKQFRPLQLVIAGNCKNRQEEVQYEQVILSAKTRKCGSQISVLKSLPKAQEKSLMDNAAIIVCCAKANLNADFLLKALCLGKPIVASNRGIAGKLIKNRITGITVDPEPSALAVELKKLITSPFVGSFMGEVAKDCFNELYSFKSFCKKLHAVSFPPSDIIK